MRFGTKCVIGLVFLVAPLSGSKAEEFNAVSALAFLNDLTTWQQNNNAIQADIYAKQVQAANVAGRIASTLSEQSETQRDEAKAFFGISAELLGMAARPPDRPDDLAGLMKEATELAMGLRQENAMNAEALKLIDQYTEIQAAATKQQAALEQSWRNYNAIVAQAQAVGLIATPDFDPRKGTWSVTSPARTSPSPTAPREEGSHPRTPMQVGAWSITTLPDGRLYARSSVTNTDEPNPFQTFGLVCAKGGGLKYSFEPTLRKEYASVGVMAEAESDAVEAMAMTNNELVGKNAAALTRALERDFTPAGVPAPGAPDVIVFTIGDFDSDAFMASKFRIEGFPAVLRALSANCGN